MHLSDWKKQNGFYLDPFASGYQDGLARMYDACAARGLRVAAGALADCQGLSESQYLDVWHKNIEVARGRWNVLLRGGNEDHANAWNCDVLDRPQNMGGVLCSRGSRGIDVPPSNHYWDWIEWEGRRDPGMYHKCLDDAGSGGLELLAGYEAIRKRGRPIPGADGSDRTAVFSRRAGRHMRRYRWTDQRRPCTGLSIATNGPGRAFGASDRLMCRRLGDRAPVAQQFLPGCAPGSSPSTARASTR